MLALQPQVAHAQAFQGTETVILGSVTRGTSGNTDFFTVNAAQNTINWSPTDTAIGGGPINFLPAGATASFFSGAGLPYTVLNRIIAADQSRAIAFSGTVTSDALGSIWFYAPGGLLLNAGSQFNVGSLLLTANDPVGAAAGQPYLNAANQFQLRAASGSTAGVTINGGASISVNNYMIAVAPRFTMNGAATVGRSAALVAAEDVSFTLNGGLFDITANVGTAAGGTSAVGGSITGPGGISGQGLYSRLYMMAVPRNNAMTLLITGGAQLGFDVANAADVDGNAVVLSGGYDIVGSPFGQGPSQFGTLPVTSSNANALVRVENKTITSSLTIRSKNEARVSSTQGALNFASDLQLFADGLAIVDGDGLPITVAGNLLLDASTQFTGLSAGASRTAGTAQIITGGAGSVQVIGDIVALANGFGDEALSPGLAGGTGRGGTVIVNPNDGNVRAASMVLQADGVGGIAQDGIGGSGIGGSVTFETDALGSVLLSGNLTINANAAGAVGSAGRLSGNAQAGQATANILGTGFTVPGSLSVTANAFFVEEVVAPHLAGGTATGGTARITVANGGSLAANNIDLTAFADAGNGAGAGNSFVGGSAILGVTDVGGTSSVIAPGGLYIDAGARAANGQSGGNVNGGSATGGFAQLFGTGNPLLSFGNDETTITANAVGGDGLGGIGGNAFGGRANVDLQNGGSLLIASNLLVSAESFGGNGTIGGNAVGRDQGDANPPAVFLRLGPNVGGNDQGIQVNGLLLAFAGAQGGNGSTGNGGNATGGFVVVRGQSGTISANSLLMAADATAGQGVGGGAARSGRLFGRFEDANLTTSSLTFNLNADGGNASNAGSGGSGGNATVGQLFFFLDSLEAGPGTNVNAGAVTLLAAARGGSGGSVNTGTGGAGGDAFGVDPLAIGPQLVIASRPARSSFIATQLVVDNSATGGEGGGGTGTANGGGGGDALGGQLIIGTDAGPITPLANQSVFDFGTLFTVDARVTGGTGGGIDGDGIGGRGGDAEGGSATLLARGSVVTAGAVSILASAFGGDGGSGGSNGDLGGGAAVGGEALILATPHVTAGLPVDVTISGPVTLIATALGGSSHQEGGEGQAGTVGAYLQRHEDPNAVAVSAVGSMSIASFSADASGVGGAALGNGARGGDGLGGDIELIADGGTFALPGAQLTAIGRGAAGAPGNTGDQGGDGGGGYGGTATVNVRPGAVFTIGSLNVNVSASAGNGGDGGNGAAGAAPDPLPLGQRDGNPGGDGGSGGEGGWGGEAQSGDITIGTDPITSGGTLNIASWDLLGVAQAGTGGNGGAGGSGANGSDGLDGDSIFVNGGNGGAGGNGGQGGNAGRGGSGLDGRLVIGSIFNSSGTPWTLNVPLITASMSTTGGSSGSGGQGGAPGLGGAGGAPGPDPGVAGTAGPNGVFGGFGTTSFAGFTEGPNLQVLLYNADLTTPGIDLNADSVGVGSPLGGEGGDADGGGAFVLISGGTTSLGYVRLRASGTGGSSVLGLAGRGFGGSAELFVVDGANVTLNGGQGVPLELVARGIGGDGLDGGQGGNGGGGTARTTVNAARLQVNGDLFMDVNSSVGANGVQTSAAGGGANLLFDDGSDILVTGRLLMTATGNGWQAGGGGINITGFGNGQLVVQGDADLFANAFLDSGQASAFGSGGQIAISTNDGNRVQIGGGLFADAALSSFDVALNPIGLGGLFTWDHRGIATVGGPLQANAGAFFGDGAGGEAFGGSVAITAFSGSLTTGGLSLSASADGGFVNGGTPAASIGGSVLLRADAGASLSSIGGNVSLVVNGTGSTNGNGPGADGSAGTVSLGADGTLELDMGGSGTFIVDTIGRGGDSLSGDLAGDGFGGGIDFIIGPGGTLNILNPLSTSIELRASGTGGTGLLQGGTGFGGGIFLISEGSLNTPALTLNVRGEGGLGAISGNALGGRAEISVFGGLTNIAGDLVLDGNAVVPGGSNEGNGTGGDVSIDLSGGSLDVAGNLSMLANGDGVANTGGTIAIDAQAGVLTVGGGIDLSARSLNDTFAGNAVIQGGDISIVAGSLGEIRSLLGLTADASGTASTPLYGVTARGGSISLQSAGLAQLGGSGLNLLANAGWAPGAEGGNAVGGVATVALNGGSLDTTDLLLQAFAMAGGNSGGTGGVATGGTATLLIENTAVATVTGLMAMNGYGDAGGGLVGGSAAGGSVAITTRTGGQLQGSALIDALAAGARGGNGADGNGGNAVAGTVLVRAETGSNIDVGRIRAASVAATAGNGDGAGNGGSATSGTIEIRADNATIAIAGIESLTASANGGNALGSGDGGLGVAGTSAVVADNGGNIAVVATSGTIGVALTAAGVGGNAVSGRGGEGRGGTVQVFTNGGQITLDGQVATTTQVSLRAQGIGGTGGSGGTGTGGQVIAGTDGDARLTLLGTSELVSEGTGGTATQGLGGDAFSGAIALSMSRAVATSSITAGELTFLAAATAGNGAGAVGGGGSAESGGVFIGSTNNRGSMTIGNVTATVAAIGGRGGDGPSNDGGNGGDAIAGGVRIGFLNNDVGGPDAGTINTGVVTADASAFGGAGGIGSSADGAGGNGGQASAGSVILRAIGGTLRIAPLLVGQPAITATVDGIGGQGGAGLIAGSGGGGFGAEIILGSAANNQAGGQLGRFESGGLLLSVNGEGGAGAVGGEGFAGGINLDALAGTVLVNGSMVWSGTGLGGDSLAGIGGQGAGGGFDLLGAITATAGLVIDGSGRGGNGSTGGGRSDGGSVNLRGNVALQGGIFAAIESAGGAALQSGNGGVANGGSVELSSAFTEAMVISGPIDIIATAVGGSGASGGDANGSVIRLLTSQPGASLDLGPISIDANTTGGDGGAVPPQGPARGGNSTGGSFTLQATGSVRVRGDLQLDQSRLGGSWLAGDGNGGAASGGPIGIRAFADPNLGGGILQVDGQLLVTAQSIGGTVNLGNAGNGGTALGGTVTMTASGPGSMRFDLGASLDLASVGGTTSQGSGGQASGARLVGLANGSTMVIGGSGLDLIVTATGGAGDNGGPVFGGSVDMFVDNGRLEVAGDTSIDVTATGGVSLFEGAGGTAGGADVRILTAGDTADDQLSLSETGGVTILGTSVGGAGGSGSIGGAGGNATGATIQLGSQGSSGRVALGDLAANVNASGGAGGAGTVNGAGGRGFAGFMQLGMDGGRQGPAGDFVMAGAVLSATGVGGDAGGAGAAHGEGLGGFVAVRVAGATGSVAGDVTLTADGRAGGSGLPGNAALGRGGVLELGSDNGVNGIAGSLTIAGAVAGEANGAGSGANGAPGESGVVRVFARDGSDLAMASLSTLAGGNLASTQTQRGGIVADQGSTISISGNGQIVSVSSLGLNDGGTITVGGTLFVSSAGQVQSAFGAPTAGATGVVTAARFEVAGNTGIDLATNSTGSTDVLLNSAAGSVQIGDLDANRDISITGTTGIAFTSLRGDRTVNLNAPGGVTGGSVSAGGRIIVTSDVGATLGALDAGIVDPFAGVTPDIFVRALGPLTTGAVTSGGDVGLVAQGALTTGAITSGRDLVLLSAGTITTAALATPTTARIRLGDFAQSTLIAFPLGVPDYSGLFAAAPAPVAGNIVINGNVTTGLFEARATGLLQVTGTINATLGARLAGQNLQIGSTSTTGFLDLTAVDDLVLGDLAAQGQISVASSGSITTGAITTGQSLVLSAGGAGASLTTGNVRADGEIRLSSNTTLTTGTLSSGNRVFLTAGGPIATGAIDAGTVNPQAGASGVLFATSPGTISTGPINVSGSATLSGVLGVTTGNVVAPGGIVLLDTGGINAGNLTTSPSGFVYIAAHDLLPQISFDQAGNPQFAALLASTPIRLIGNINVNDVSTGRFIAAATGNFFVNNATAATSMLVDIGGTATLDFNINTPSLTVTSSDIVLDPLAAVGVAGGSVRFNIGSGVTSAIIGGASAASAPGTYRLSNGEFGALRASSITVTNPNGGMTIDQLALPAIPPGQAANPGITLQTSGIMRVTGAVTMAQAGAENRLNLVASSRIEVVQGSGSVRLGAGVDTPAGILAITTPRLWVASDSLLNQLAGTALAGQARIDAVNAAGAPSVVGGSIGAGTIQIGSGDEVLIQNSGTNQLKAGFTAGTGGLRISRAFEGNNPIPVVINGRIQRPDNSFAINNDTLALVQLNPGISLVAADSTVNGCLIVTAACPDLLPDEISQPLLTIINNVEALTPEEEAQREAARAAGERLPILQLQRLIDFGPLFGDPDATDPVTSGGNPALWMDPMPRGVRAPGGLK